MRSVFFVIAGLVAGFVGGVLGARLTLHREQALSEQVVRARSFELLDEAGQAISYWGIDNNKNAVLAFGSHWPTTKVRGGSPSGHPPGRLEDLANQRVAIGVIDEGRLQCVTASGLLCSAFR